MSADAEGSFIAAPPQDVGGWVELFEQREIPILGTTALAIEELRLNEDAVDAHLLAGTLGDDPLMTLKLFRHVARNRSRRAVSDAETVLSAIVMLGIPPFFRAFGHYTVIEQQLSGHPEALEGLRMVMRRAHRAARFALGFAVHRMDHDAAVIHEAALLHDFAEMMLWAHAPALAIEMARRQQAEPTLRSVDVQRRVINIELADLQQALMQRWRLPELLVRISSDRYSGNASPQLRNVQLAMRVARHSAQGWDNPALPDDLVELGALLSLSTPHVQQLLNELDA
jgi:HD-like signal output (HDOD) protein